MSNVVDITKNQPHITGEAVCLCCDHKWVAVAPVGTIDLVCPECGTDKGVFAGLITPELVWTCNCGSIYFHIDEHGAICVKCGARPEID